MFKGASNKSMFDSQTIKFDVCIIGSGLAGMASTLFAANRGLSSVQVGLTGEIIFTRRLNDDHFQPGVFEPGTYTIHVGEPGTSGGRP